MATNKRKVMLPHTMGQQGMSIVKARDDIETVIYPAGIAQTDLLPLLAHRPRGRPAPRLFLIHSIGRD